MSFYLFIFQKPDVFLESKNRFDFLIVNKLEYQPISFIYELEFASRMCHRIACLNTRTALEEFWLILTETAFIILVHISIHHFYGFSIKTAKRFLFEQLKIIITLHLKI